LLTVEECNHVTGGEASVENMKKKKIKAFSLSDFEAKGSPKV